MKKKLKWHRPTLVILTRGESQELVLSWCKGRGDDVEICGYNDQCLTTGADTCQVACRDVSSS